MRLTQQSLRILKIFLDRPGQDFTGAEIIRETGFSSGTVYPILIRCETDGLLDSKWEKARPKTLGRPRRRLYSITRHGREIARNALDWLQDDE